MTRVIPSTTKEAIAPPTALTVMKSTVDIVGDTLNTIATPFARRASSTETTRLRISAAVVFWPTTVSRRGESWNTPVWIEVPRRLPSAPKMLPFTARAAGTSSSRPGSSSSVSVVVASVIPATRLAMTATNKATNASRYAMASPPTAVTSHGVERRRVRDTPSVWSFLRRLGAMARRLGGFARQRYAEIEPSAAAVPSVRNTD